MARILLLALVLLPAAASAARERALPPAVDALLACRAETDAARRLACFDRESATLSAAISARDVVVVNQAQVRATGEALFGLPRPRGVELVGDSVGTIDQVLEAVAVQPDGNSLFTMKSGQQWLQLDGRFMGREPKPGDPVTIHRSTFGRMEAVFGKLVRQVRRLR